MCTKEPVFLSPFFFFFWKEEKERLREKEGENGSKTKKTQQSMQLHSSREKRSISLCAARWHRFQSWLTVERKKISSREQRRYAAACTDIYSYTCTSFLCSVLTNAHRNKKKNYVCCFFFFSFLCGCHTNRLERSGIEIKKKRKPIQQGNLKKKSPIRTKYLSAMEVNGDSARLWGCPSCCRAHVRFPSCASHHSVVRRCGGPPGSGSRRGAPQHQRR